MLFLLSVMLWFSFMIFPQTHADLIDNRDVDIIQDEVDIEYESDDFEDLGESEDFEEEPYEDIDTLNLERNVAPTVTVSNHGELQNAINTTPANGTRTILVETDFTLNGSVLYGVVGI